LGPRVPSKYEIPMQEFSNSDTPHPHHNHLAIPREGNTPKRKRDKTSAREWDDDEGTGRRDEGKGAGERGQGKHNRGNGDDGDKHDKGAGEIKRGALTRR
jgi:hypothetical protein